MHPDLEEAIHFHDEIVTEGGKALVGYDTAKALLFGLFVPPSVPRFW